MNNSPAGSIREVIKISLPLVMASLGHAINLFSDRMMLAWYSQAAVAAAFPAGLTSFALSCFFFGMVAYTNTFVAQYHGAKENRRIGSVVWQGIWLALIGGAIMIGGYFWAPYLIALFQHSPEITKLEIVYYRILSIGTFIPLALTALSAFWAGRGRTVMVMTVNLVVAVINIVCNYFLIFGHSLNLPVFGTIVIPEMGIAGAGWGTNFAGTVGVAIYAVGFFLPARTREKYGTLERIFDSELLKRMFRFGAPNGGQMFLDLASFNLFVILLGTISPMVQEAASIAFGLNSLSVIPMIGLGQTVAVLVGRAIGARDISYAKRATRNAGILMVIYTAMMISLFVFKQDWALWFFVRADDPQQVEALAYTSGFLHFIAAYILFDGMYIIYSGALKGAGDTRFGVWANGIMAFGLFLPACFIYKHFSDNVWGLWIIIVAYIALSGLVFFTRYLCGKWQKMSVIETLDRK